MDSSDVRPGFQGLPGPGPTGLGSWIPGLTGSSVLNVQLHATGIYSFGH